jgi:hypothetical protein
VNWINFIFFSSTSIMVTRSPELRLWSGMHRVNINSTL